MQQVARLKEYMNEVKKETLKKETYIRFLKGNTPFLAFLFLFVIAVLVERATFFNINNLINILLNNAIIGIIALGMMLIIITAGIDLSVGSMLALTGLISVWVLNKTNSIILTVAVTVIAGSVFGLLTGVFVARYFVPSFIVTLGTMYIYRSLAEYWFNGGGLTASGIRASTFIGIANTTF
ncbi:ABC transporter permease [Pediococcus siamensis]|uniref:ABC transporter permease n=1 Tax=Pediococcus siamensis TaxID=381829 RepID=UPI0039A25F52